MSLSGLRKRVNHRGYASGEKQVGEATESPLENSRHSVVPYKVVNMIHENKDTEVLAHPYLQLHACNTQGMEPAKMAINR